MTKLVFLTLLLFSVNFLWAQQQDENWCGFDKWLDEEIQSKPDFLINIAEFINANRFADRGERDELLIIPVVFHIIHDGGPSNISMAQILNGIAVMNEDFRALNMDSVQIRNSDIAPFLAVFADVNVEFRLAKIDPDGNCTNGVQRRFAPHLTNEAGEACKYDANGGLDAWPNNRYLNIWTVNSIGSSGGQGITLGYAFLPYNNWGPGHGILNRHDRVGRIGTAAQFGGRTLTHEMGHICGLLHTFQGGCSNEDCSSSGDFICDTPPAEQVFGCNPTLNTCEQVPPNDFFGFDALDQNENHMSYNTCRFMFSEGQKELMRTNFASIPNFVSLTSQQNLSATGVLLPDVVCKAAFYTRDTVVCAGQSILFIDDSFHAPTSWSWSFPGGMPEASNDQNPLVNYDEPGIYEVSLTVSDGENTATTTKSAYIIVLPEGETLPYFEGFESYSAIPNSNWSVVQPANAIGFAIADDVGHSGSKSLFLENFNLPSGRLTEAVSNLIDLSDVSGNMTLSFRYAYRKKASSNNERLQVLLSNDCGESWAARRTISGNALGTQLSAISWKPTSKEDWVTVHMTNVTSLFWVANFRFKFSFLSDNGNNLFIDDINIYNGNPSDEIILSNQNLENHAGDIKLYPNPASSEVVLSFHAPIADVYTIQLLDNLGKVIFQSSINAEAGLNDVYVSLASLASGIYQLTMSESTGFVHAMRLVKQ